MFGFLKKKKAEKTIVDAPTSGTLIDLSDVSDPVFAQRMMGDGFAIKPDASNGKFEIVAPVSGKVVSLPSTKHAVGIHTDNGVDILIHIGIDTVNLKGNGFTALVNQDDNVNQGESLVRVNDELLKQNRLDDTVMIIFASGYDQKIGLSQDYGTEITAGQRLIG